MSRVPRIAVTPGEPAGIGPDIIAALIGEKWPAELVLIADPHILHERGRSLGLTLKLETFDAQRPLAPGASCLPIALNAPARAGTLDKANAPYVLATLEAAARGCLAGRFDALFTGPVHKGIVNEAGIAFTGHTEFLAELSACPQPVMMLAARDLRVALLTTHLPLKEVSQAISDERLKRVARILHQDLQKRFGIQHPRILVCGLNPHAGEGGHMGREEIEVIEPALAALREEGLDLTGPLPADTAFTPRHLKDADAVLAMYHDQGLPVLKYAGFGQAVNITLGLPFIRTSVDHGTALELAGTGAADPGSAREALQLAIDLSMKL